MTTITGPQHWVGGGSKMRVVIIYVTHNNGEAAVVSENFEMI